MALVAVLAVAVATGVAFLVLAGGSAGPQESSSPSIVTSDESKPISPVLTPPGVVNPDPERVSAGPQSSAERVPAGPQSSDRTAPLSTASAATEPVGRSASPTASAASRAEEDGTIDEQTAAASSTLEESPVLQSSKSVEIDFRQFRQLLPRDAIFPIYEPNIVPAGDADLKPGELVIGVNIDGESRAYPIGPLVRREMVNDTVAGVPILVSW